jgi:hypothetical protein
MEAGWLRAFVLGHGLVSRGVNDDGGNGFDRPEEKVNRLSGQSIVGLCFLSQGIPRIR